MEEGRRRGRVEVEVRREGRRKGVGISACEGRGACRTDGCDEEKGESGRLRGT